MVADNLIFSDSNTFNLKKFIFLNANFLILQESLQELLSKFKMYV